jgi:hypothetical protein
MHPRIRRIAPAVLAATGILLGSTSCGNLREQGRSPSILVIDSLEAASGASPGELGVPLNSDVLTEGGILNDTGLATMRIVIKDPGNPGADSFPSAVNAVQVTRFRVSFKRADGRNTPGVDVPFPFDGATTATVTPAPVDVPFEMVRHQAKAEQPLRALRESGGKVLISTIAEVTFYGRDLVGNDVQASGTISVNFADFADP